MITVHRHAGRRGQARLADHPGEQVLRRDLHRAEPEQLPVADAAPAGRAADELLRHRPLQHGQLHLAGVGPVPVLRHPGRLLDGGEHDQQQQRDHHDRHGRDTLPTPTRPPTAAGTTPTAPAPTAAGNGNYGQLLVHGGVDAALGQQRLRLPDRRPDTVQPVQRGRRLLEGLRPGPRRRPARRARRPT